MKRASKIYTALIFIFLFAPIAILLVFSFNESKSLSVFSGFSLKWYGELFRDGETLRAVRNTLLLTAAVLAVTLVLGVLVDRIVLRPQGEPFADAEAMQAFLADAEQEGYASSILSVDAERHTVYLREEMLSVRARRASSREFFAAAMLMEMAYAFWRGRKLLREDEKPGGRS